MAQEESEQSAEEPSGKFEIIGKKRERSDSEEEKGDENDPDGKALGLKAPAAKKVKTGKWENKDKPQKLDEDERQLGLADIQGTDEGKSTRGKPVDVVSWHLFHPNQNSCFWGHRPFRTCSRI